MALWGEPRVWQTMFWPRTLLLYGVLGPLVSWTALMLAAIVSSRVNDARTAQQLGGVHHPAASPAVRRRSSSGSSCSACRRCC